jgi:hypothetical protein
MGKAAKLASIASSWTTATRPSVPFDGLLGFNTSTGSYEWYNSGTWNDVKKFSYISASDPLSTTNPNNVGDAWFNTTTGEVFYCTSKTTNANKWVGTNGSTVVPVLALYNLGDKNISVTGDWGWNYTSSGSSHNVVYNADNANVTCVGSGSTGIGISTRWYTNNAIAIPSWAKTLEVYAYVTIKDSNNNDAGGSIEYGLGSTNINRSAINVDISTALGTQDALYWTTTIDISSVAGQSLYFTAVGSGGQYANVQFNIYSVKIKG